MLHKLLIVRITFAPCLTPPPPSALSSHFRVGRRWIHEFYQILIQETSEHCIGDQSCYTNYWLIFAPFLTPSLSWVFPKGGGRWIQKLYQIAFKKCLNIVSETPHVIKTFHIESHICLSLYSPPSPEFTLQGKGGGKLDPKILPDFNSKYI